MTAPSQRPLQTHRNHYLFADYYLDNRLAEHREWQQTDPGPAFERLSELWRAFSPQADNESQTEYEWIRPVLQALGHRFNVQVPLKTPFGTRQPDYVLFPDEAARQAAKAGNGAFSSRELQSALAIADAKAWDRNLDRAQKSRALKRGLTLSENPSLQIYIYVQHSGLPWGLLTNGRLWRLYHRDTAEKLDVFYEADLPALIEQGDPEAFKYFHLFFRRPAFRDRPDRPAWLERVLEQSRAYARGVSDTLKDQVYEALRHLAEGFLAFPANQLEPNPASLKAIYDHSLIVLYRLLFILYAESRGLLPVPSNPLYTRSYSLDALKKRLARELDGDRPAAPSMATTWQQLSQLWQVIDGGNPDLAVPAYDGGLFRHEPDSFLNRYQVGDLHLRRAIDLLARTRDPETKARVFVDYRDLEIRHLGSIYEGLLEYRVRVADQPLAIRTERGREVYTPLNLTGHENLTGLQNLSGLKGDSKADVQPGQLYLTTDKGERKATGSYYTPDYIVKYIVEQTVRPVLDGLRARYSDAEGQVTDPAGLEQAVLNVNVLDPSMGSGHFLVEATDFIARYMVALDLPAPEEADEGETSDLAYWRRRVAQACIYGVDVNPLAVELAKLSLWLTTVALGKPLSFLDHHLRCGNSLIGARVADLPLEAATPTSSRRRAKRQQQAEEKARAAGQLSMLDDSAFAGSMRTATGFMSQIETLRGDTLADVRQAEQLYRRVVEEVTQQARHLADVWTARTFGMELDETLWAGLARHLLHGGFELPQFNRILEQAAQLAAEHRFFHWELEFPEVFFDEHGTLIPEGGFEAVVGNPPYVRQEELGPLKDYFAEVFSEVYHGVADLYIYFYSQGIDLLGKDGRIAYISSGTFARANFAKPFRKVLPKIAEIETLIDFGENQPFEGAEMVRPSIVVLKKGRQEKSFRSLFIAKKIPESLDLALAEEGIDCSPKSLEQPEWTFQSVAETRLFEKILEQSIPLGKVVDGEMYRGVLTGFNEAFYIDQATRDRLIEADSKSAEVIKPTLNGADLRPWYQEDQGNWLVFTYRGINIEEYPSIKAYLEQYREQLEPRPNDWNKKGKWPGRKPGPYKWYEIQDAIKYRAEFEKPKILWPDISKLPRFSWDNQNKYINNTSYMLPDPHPSLLGILQSRALWFAVSQICQPLRLRAGLWQYRMIAQFMNRLPIPDVPDDEKEAIGDLAMAITEQARARYDLHRQSRHRILSDLSTPKKKKLNQKLTAWWTLDFATFRKEVKKVFKQDLPLAERDDWEIWLNRRRARHEQFTAEIVRLETELNERVYHLFKLTPAEIEIIEESTKYGYGEV